VEEDNNYRPARYRTESPRGHRQVNWRTAGAPSET